MSKDILGERRKALEETFFAKRNKELLQQLSQQLATEEKRNALSTACGVSDPQVLDRLVSLNIDVETLSALCLVPLLQVAWADGSVAAKEREAILAASADTGMKSGDAGHQLLETWLKEEPDPQMLSVWKDYVAALGDTLGGDVFSNLKNDLLDRARQVAEAAGGILGLGKKVSSTEQAVLDELGRAFDG